jgi:beta-aspartyl-peptidase (threonine type)
MDAAIMDGTSKAVGAVAGVTRIKNPIRAAQLLMKSGEDVLMVGAGAEARAQALDPALTMASKAYFREHKACQDTSSSAFSDAGRHGTVGAVALDRSGRLVAGTSTGGYPGKRPGRIGDSPLVGAGTYADKRVAFSSSGIGEYFIRYNVTHTVAERMKLLGEPMDVAVQRTFDEVYAEEGLLNSEIDFSRIKNDPVEGQNLKKILDKFHALGIGGVIGLDAQGNPFDYFRFSAFARGYRRASDPEPVVRVDGPIDAIR